VRETRLHGSEGGEIGQPVFPTPIPISTVSLIEGHGTGTALGDKVEISALRRLLDASSGDGICWLGSIKANIGHCKAAAGAVGLIKAVMALKRKILPPMVNCERPNPVFGKLLDRLRPNLQGQVWASGATPRRASVSSMGFGGANSHLTLEEANPYDTLSPEDLALLGSNQESELILLSAESRQDLQRQVDKLIPIAERIYRAELTDLAAALAHTQHTGTVRMALVVDSPWQLAASLQSLSQKLAMNGAVSGLDAPDKGIFAGATVGNPSFVALFPGQGSQRLNMGEHLLRRYPFIHDLYDQAEHAVADVLSDGLRATIFRDLLAADEATRAGWEAELRHTRIAQPAIVLSLAMLRLLEFFGLRPTLDWS
jgi:acyl transferase domain-containing protein